MKTVTTIETATTIPSPNGVPVPVTLTAVWVFETNPYDKEPERYRGEDDGWTLTRLSVCEGACA